MSDKIYISELPNLMKEWDWDKNNKIGLTPNSLSSGSSKKAWWKCSLGHKWEASIYERACRNSNCPYCSNNKIQIGFNDLFTTNPDLAKEWHPTKNGELTPYNITSGSNKKVWWLCSKGHEWQAVIGSRSSGRGCPTCSKQKGLISFNDLKIIYPKLSDEWNYDKNGLIDLNAGINKAKQKIWWKCKSGHEWEATISRRLNKGQTCPVCRMRRVVLGKTDLATLNPQLALEWHPTKNGDLTPNSITPRSGLKVWWVCSKGHEWQATPHDRDMDNTKCPYCSARRQTSFPEQAIYFYIKKLFPDTVNRYKDIFSNSMELDIFIPSISIGVEYDGLNWHRTKEEHIREIKKYEICKAHNITLIRVKENHQAVWNDVADKTFYVERRRNFAKLTQLINTLLAYILNIRGGVDTSAPLTCKITVDLEKDQAEIHSYLSDIENSLEELRPDLVEEWDFKRNGCLIPSMFSLHSNDYVWWKCKQCGHKWRALINTRTRPNGSGCAICGKAKRGKTFHKGYISVNGSLSQNNPELAEEWHPVLNKNLSPDNITAASPIKVWWLCKKCGHEWQSAPNNRSKGVGCPCCSGRVPKIGVNDLATINPTLASEWNPTKNAPILPNMVLPKSGKKVWWKCLQCGHEWQASPHTRSAGHGCPYCSGRVAKIGVNDLATINPYLASEWHPSKNMPLMPNMILPNCSKKVWWKCPKCAHEWQATVSSRFNDRGCPNCRNIKRKKTNKT